MSSHEWLPEGPRSTPDGPVGRPYLLVPALVIGRNLHVNAAGWSDSSPGGLICKICNKQIRGQLSQLALFPLVKKDMDLFRFTYVLPPHRTGGGFSIEICRGSGTSLTRDVERPTSVRFPGDGDVSDGQVTGAASEPKEEAGDTARAQEELTKKLESMSPEEAEERYNYLNAKSISELTDEEYEERLALAQKLSEKQTEPSKKKP